MVPEGWSKYKIKDIASIQVGRDLQVDRYSNVRTETHIYPVYSNTVENKGLYGFYDFPEYSGKSVTIVGRGIGLGTAFARFENEKFGAIGRLLVISPKSDLFDVGYLADYINFSLRIYNEDGGIPQLPGAALANYHLTLPPISEQKIIAQILSTWDQAIATTEKLLENSQKQKQALMQQLLTGKKRFSGFVGEWANSKIQSLVTISKGEQLNRDGLIESDIYPVINGGISPSGYTDKPNTKANTITISEGGNSCGYVALQTSDFWCGGHCYALKSPKLPLLFLYQLLKFNEKKIMRLRVGSGLPNIQKKDLESLHVTYPVNIEEQMKIGAVLSAADEQIKSIEKKLDFLKEEKKALMQQLLTGKRRVRV